MPSSVLAICRDQSVRAAAMLHKTCALFLEETNAANVNVHGKLKMTNFRGLVGPTTVVIVERVKQ